MHHVTAEQHIAGQHIAGQTKRQEIITSISVEPEPLLFSTEYK